MLSDAHFLAVAYIVSDAGTCSRLKVGAILVKDRRIISTGYNGAASGQPHCSHRDWEGEETELVKGCQIAVHAEVNAIAFAARHGVSTIRTIMYTTDSPCLNCARLIANSGVEEVRYGRAYRNTDGLNELQGSGIRTQELGEPELHLVRVVSGDQPGVYTSKPPDKKGKHQRLRLIEPGPGRRSPRG